MDKTSYALGVSIAQNMMKNGVRTITVADFSKGVGDVFAGRGLQMSPDEANSLLQKMSDHIQDEENKKALNLKTKGEEFLAANKKKDGVITTQSGLQYRVITEGTGPAPTAHGRVRCHYEGRFISGEKFDSSYDRNKPADFGLDQVIPGWTEGLQLMKTGSKYEFYIPYQLGYGNNGIPGVIPGYSTLIFTVELLELL